MRLIFVYGLPATGKLTVARELAKLTGYKLFHNHLAVDLLLSVFEFGSAAFVRLREEIWLSVFEEASRSEVAGLIFTFNPENTVRPEFVDAAITSVQQAGGETDFVELTCPLEDLKRRLDGPSRLQHRKLSSVTLFESLHEQGTFDTSHMPKPFLTVDTSQHSPIEAAKMIHDALSPHPN